MNDPTVGGPSIFIRTMRLWWVDIDDDGWGFGGLVVADREQRAVDLALEEYGQSLTAAVRISAEEVRADGQGRVLKSYSYERDSAGT